MVTNGCVRKILLGTPLYVISCGQGCRRRGRRGCKRTPKSFGLVKIWAKPLEIRAKSGEIWLKSVKTFAKIPENLGKVPENTSKNGAQHLLIWKNGAQGALNWRNGTQYGLHEKIFAHEVVQKFFGQVWNSGKNLSHPQKLACSYTYGCSHSLHIKLGRYALNRIQQN